MLEVISWGPSKEISLAEVKGYVKHLFLDSKNPTQIPL